MAKKSSKGRLQPRKPEFDDDDDFTADAGGDSLPSPKDTADAEDEASPKKRKAKIDDYFDEEDDKPAKAEKEVTKKKAEPIRKVNFDKRALSGKAKLKLSNWTGRTRGKMLDKFFTGIAAQARKKSGHSSVLVGSDSDALVVCIPMYAGHGQEAHKYPGCLPMEFVMANDGFPLGLVIQLVATHGIGKSALLAEFFRWFGLAGGGGQLSEAETKFNPLWYRSIQGNEMFERTPITRCKSVEGWQRSMTDNIFFSKTEMIGTKEAPGPGRTIPICYGVDSIMGKSSEETQEKILGKVTQKGERGTTGEGAADRGFPIEALKITRYMRTIPGELDEWPFAIVLINHLRMKTDDNGNPLRNKAGGEQVNFQESIELELKKIGGHKKKIEAPEFEGFPVEISCEKNSFGPTHRRIQTRLLWWEEVDEATGEFEQRTIWDWDWSTIHLLNSLMEGAKVNPRLKKNLKDIDFHLECPEKGEVENLAWSKSLDMKAADALPWSQVGAMIRENSDLSMRLRQALRINRRPVMEGEYLEYLDRLARGLV